MSGIVGGVDYSILFSGSATTNAASGILTALYSGAGAAGGVSTGNPILDLKLAEQNQAKDVAREAKDPTVMRDLAAFRSAVAKAPDIKTALQNPNVMKVLLTANGLASQLQYTALASKALLSDPSDPKSLVNQLSDSRWKTVAQTYNLGQRGLAGLQDPKVQAQLASAYAQVTWMNSLDAATPGLAEALQFKQQASKITNVDQILGDPINWQVVLTALGIPQQIAFQDIGAREHAVASRLDVTKLQDPKFVNALTDRYLLAKQQASQGAAAAPSLDALSAQARGLTV